MPDVHVAMILTAQCDTFHFVYSEYVENENKSGNYSFQASPRRLSSVCMDCCNGTALSQFASVHV